MSHPPPGSKRRAPRELIPAARSFHLTDLRHVRGPPMPREVPGIRQGGFPIHRLDPPAADAVLEVVVDYVDPGSWLAFLHLERALPDGAPERARLRWRPLELAPAGAPPRSGQDPAWRAMTEAVLEEARALGAAPHPALLEERGSLPRTRKAHELALHAREMGSFEAVNRALFEARFLRGEDVGRIDLLVAVAERAGLDPGDARTVLGVDRFADAVEAERAALLEGGVLGVPTLRLAGSPASSVPPPLEGFGGNALFAPALRALLAELGVGTPPSPAHVHDGAGSAADSSADASAQPLADGTADTATDRSSDPSDGSPPESPPQSPASSNPST